MLAVTGWRALAASAVVMATVAGCANSGDVYQRNARYQALEEELSRIRADNARLRDQVVTMESQAGQPRVVEKIVEVPVAGPATAYPGSAALPPANPGECYARVLIPATYETVTEEVVSREAGQRIEVIPAEYDWVDEQVLVKEAGEEIVEVIPAQYDWVEETVIVKEAWDEVVVVPARYETVTEQVLVRPGYTVWKPGRGPVEKVDHGTGEIMCLVEVPAEYKTVTREVLAEAEHTQVITHPAEYDTVRRRVMTQPADVIRRPVPAEYDIVRRQVVVRPAQEVRIDVPAQYSTVTQERKVTDEFVDWRPVICETNMTPGLVQRVQEELNSRGYNAGRVDGVIGRDTLRALRRFQQDNGLAEGGLTVETVNRMGIRMGSGSVL